MTNNCSMFNSFIITFHFNLFYSVTLNHPGWLELSGIFGLVRIELHWSMWQIKSHRLGLCVTFIRASPHLTPNQISVLRSGYPFTKRRAPRGLGGTHKVLRVRSWPLTLVPVCEAVKSKSLTATVAATAGLCCHVVASQPFSGSWVNFSLCLKRACHLNDCEIPSCQIAC